MNVEIKDTEALTSLRGLEVATYLRAKNWKCVNQTSQVSIWETADSEFEVAVPQLDTFRDYARRMAEVLQTIATAEERSQSEVYSDLLTAFADVVRIRIDDPASQDGTLPIEANVQIAQKARDLVMAAACTVTGPRAVWHSRKPDQAIEHVRKLRIGQSERGSYVITIISRVKPALNGSARGDLFERDTPFERKMIQSLARSLVALDQATADAAATGSYHSFEQAIPKGVSTNLCDAVAGLWGEGSSQKTLEFSFSWSPARPVFDTFPSKVRFTADRILYVEEASRLLKEQQPVEDFELVGAVVKLDRQPESSTGKATVLGAIDGRQRNVVLELGESDYHFAVAAHEQQKAIRCLGTLTRENRGYRLDGVRSIVVEDEAD